MTDGYQNVPGSTDRESRLAREAGIEIFTVGVTSSINQTELRVIASQPKQDHVYVVQVYASKHLFGRLNVPLRGNAA